MTTDSAPKRLARSLDHARPRYDVIVVGSGYGGGVSAMRLARAGKRVAVIERGREFVTGEFPSRFPDMRHEMQVTGPRVSMGSPTGLYDVRLGDDMHVLVGRGLGGGSLVNAGVALRPDARVFADPRLARPDPPGRAPRRRLRAGAALAAAGARSRGAGADQIQSARCGERGAGHSRRSRPRSSSVSTDTVNPAGIAQPACTRCGDCCAGCNVGAKNTVALTYLPEAVRHGAELFTHGRVTHVAPAAGGGWTVHVDRIDTPGDGHAAHLMLAADMVILAAGTLGSTEILLRSREPRPGAVGSCAASASRPTATSSHSATGQKFRSTPSASAIPRRSKDCASAPAVSGPDRDRRPRRSEQIADDPGRRDAVGAGAGAAGHVHPQWPPARRAAKPRQRRLQRAVRGTADLLRRLARQRRRQLPPRRRPSRTRLARRQERARLPAARRRPRGPRRQGRRQLRQEPPRRQRHGRSAGDRTPARRLRDGRGP